ncbi:hypothetical protein KZ308_28510, partial [Escherichia coli]
LVVAGVIALLIFKLNLGIDFASGTRVEVASDKVLTQEQVEKDMSSIGLESDDVIITGDDKKTGVASFVGVLSQKEIADLK